MRRSLSASERLMLRWLIGLATAGMLLSLPAFMPRIVRRLDPQRERAEIAQGIERRQRAAGELTVGRDGEVRRAVVYSPAPSSQTDAGTDRWLTIYSRVLATLVIIGLLGDSYRTLRWREQQAA